MFKTLALALVLGATAWANPAPQHSACVKKIAEFGKWAVLTPNVECFNKAENVTKVLAEVCSKDRTTTSDIFEAFMRYKAARDKIAQDYLHAQDPSTRVVLRSQLQLADEMWMVQGYRSQVSVDLAVLGHANFVCRPQTAK